jgi:hypothetical protein
MQFASGSDAMNRVEEIDGELEMFQRVRWPRPDGSGRPLGNMTEDGLQYEEQLKAERAEIISKYTN